MEAAGRAGEPGAPLSPMDAGLLALRPLARHATGQVVAVARETLVRGAGGLAAVPTSQQGGGSRSDRALKPC